MRKIIFFNLGRYNKYPCECVCGIFLKNKYSAYHHKIKCLTPNKLITKDMIQRDLFFDEAEIQINKLQDSISNLWLGRGIKYNFKSK